MKRIGVLQVWQESNHFNPVVTTVADFESFRVGYGQEGLERFSQGEEVGGFVDGLRAFWAPAEPVGVFMAEAWPCGPVSTDAATWLLDRLTEALEGAGRFDGLLCAMHGAMVSQDSIDLDGDLLQLVRRRVGPEIPIVATIDLHAYLTAAMLKASDAIVAYHTSPHIDRFETGRRAARVLEAILGGATPVAQVKRLPMITTGEKTVTNGPALAPVFAKLRELEQQPQVLSASVLMTQPWLDVADPCWTTMVISDGDRALAESACADLARMCWERRASFLADDFCDAPQAVARALACDGKPVVIADGADATNSGSAGDSVHLLAAMIDRSIPGEALSIMVDPQAVAHARAAGEGGTFDFAVGGKRDHVFSRPLEVKGFVVSLRRARYVLSGHLGDRIPIDMGDAAAVKIADVTLLLVEKTGPGSSPAMYRCVGLEPADYKIVIVKSPAGFRAEFEPIAADIILTACPGCANPHVAQVPYSRLRRPVWPLDEIEDGDGTGCASEIG